MKQQEMKAALVVQATKKEVEKMSKYEKPKISYNTIKRNTTLDSFTTKKPVGKAIEEEEEASTD